jgi:hypothetical protein
VATAGGIAPGARAIPRNLPTGCDDYGCVVVVVGGAVVVVVGGVVVVVVVGRVVDVVVELVDVEDVDELVVVFFLSLPLSLESTRARITPMSTTARTTSAAISHR